MLRHCYDYKNKYANRSRISEKKFRELIRHFSIDLNASQIAKLTWLAAKLSTLYLTAIRSRIVIFYEQEFSPLAGQIEVDESDFGARRVKGKPGRGARGKTIVFGLLKREGKVYTEIIPNCSASMLQRIIQGKADINSVIHSDGWRGYNGLVDFGYKKHFRVHHCQNEFVRGTSHINGIESFWGYA